MQQKKTPQRKQRRDLSLARRIQSARARRGLSQSEAAKLWGIPIDTIQNWEIGRSKPRGFARAQLEKLLTEILGAGATPGRQ